MVCKYRHKVNHVVYINWKRIATAAADKERRSALRQLEYLLRPHTRVRTVNHAGTDDAVGQIALLPNLHDRPLCVNFSGAIRLMSMRGKGLCLRNEATDCVAVDGN